MPNDSSTPIFKTVAFDIPAAKEVALIVKQKDVGRDDDFVVLSRTQAKTLAEYCFEALSEEERRELVDEHAVEHAEPRSSPDLAPTAAVPGRITVPPMSLEQARDGLVGVHYEHGGHLLNFSRPQLEAIVRQGLPLLSEDEQREIRDDLEKCILEILEGRQADTWGGPGEDLEERLDALEDRLRALELHRQGLTDGQAERDFAESRQGEAT